MMGKMIGKSVALAVATVAMVSLVTSVSAATLYDSNGFESPVYSTGGTGDVAGQDHWTAAANPSRDGVVDFGGGIVADGSGQYVSLSRGLQAQDGVGAWYQPISYTKSAETPIVQTTWAMGIASSEFPGGLFGLELYNSAQNKVVAGLWVDSETGSLQIDAAGGSNTVVPGVGLLNNTWANYGISANFQTGKFTVSINGGDVGTWDVVNSLDSIDYVRLVSWGQYSALAHTSSQDTYGLQSYASVDGLLVSAVPEPGVLALVGSGIGLLMTRRRQR